MIPKATNEPAPIGTSSTRGEPTNPSITSKIPSATSAEGKGSSAPEMGVAASCVARASGALIAGAARTEPLLLSGTCLCAGAAWNADAESTAHSISKDLIVSWTSRKACCAAGGGVDTDASLFLLLTIVSRDPLSPFRFNPSVAAE